MIEKIIVNRLDWTPSPPCLGLADMAANGTLLYSNVYLNLVFNVSLFLGVWYRNRAGLVVWLGGVVPFLIANLAWRMYRSVTG